MSGSMPPAGEREGSATVGTATVGTATVGAGSVARGAIPTILNMAEKNCIINSINFSKRPFCCLCLLSSTELSAMLELVTQGS